MEKVYGKRTENGGEKPDSARECDLKICAIYSRDGVEGMMRYAMCNRNFIPCK